MKRFISEPFELLAHCHSIEGSTLALIYSGPRVDGLAVAEADGQYSDPKDNRRTVPVFRRGDVLVRHGTASERWEQHGIERFRRRIRNISHRSPLYSPDIGAFQSQNPDQRRRDNRAWTQPTRSFRVTTSR
jgi:hypothetical protein